MLYENLEALIQYEFKNKEHLEIAFTHKSFIHEQTIMKRECYERYEFLGDAILEYIVSEYLFETYKDMPEGKLTKLRASLVCEFTLSKISRELNLGSYGKFSKGEAMTGGADRDSILCDMFESLLGAIYLDGGIEPARQYVHKFLLTDIESKQLFYDAKTNLQEYAQKHEKTIIYELLDEQGPEHNKIFHVRAYLGDKAMEEGSGHSRKAAEQMAAYQTLLKIKE